MERNYRTPLLVEVTFSHNGDWTQELDDFDWSYSVSRAQIDVVNGRIMEVATLKVNRKADLKRVLNTMLRNVGVKEIAYMAPVNPGYPKFLKMVVEGNPSISTRYLAQVHHMLELYSVYFNGIERWWFMAFDPSRVDPFLSKLEGAGKVLEVKRRELRPEDLMESSSILQDIGLSGSEMKALKCALEMGYFQIPRRVELEDVAKVLRMSKSTVDEYIRKGISKALRTLLGEEEVW